MTAAHARHALLRVSLGLLTDHLPNDALSVAGTRKLGEPPASSFGIEIPTRRCRNQKQPRDVDHWPILLTINPKPIADTIASSAINPTISLLRSIIATTSLEVAVEGDGLGDHPGGRSVQRAST
jgi:hypothetical protein